MIVPIDKWPIEENDSDNSQKRNHQETHVWYAQYTYTQYMQMDTEIDLKKMKLKFRIHQIQTKFEKVKMWQSHTDAVRRLFCSCECIELWCITDSIIHMIRSCFVFRYFLYFSRILCAKHWLIFRVSTIIFNGMNCYNSWQDRTVKIFNRI